MRKHDVLPFSRTARVSRCTPGTRAGQRALRAGVAFFSLAAFLANGCAKRATDGVQDSRVQQAWNPPSAPERMQWDYVLDFHALPLKGQLTRIPWADTYWPSNKGGIAHRWVDTDDGFAYLPPGPEQVALMGEAELKRLSPAEKYDIYMGRFDYPTVAAERARTQPTMPAWEGLCAGWSAASLAFQEPEPTVVTGATGVRVPFGASDVKALLMHYTDKQGRAKVPLRQMGERCYPDDRNINSPTSCQDPHAGSFHVLLANSIGLRKRGFVVEINAGPEIWNHPVHGFQSEILATQPPSPGAADGTVKEVVVRTRLRYVAEVAPSWTSHRGTRTGQEEVVYEYRLEINASDQIVGGEWQSEARPDFFWFQGTPSFEGYFAGVKTIHDVSLGAPDPAVVTPPVDPGAPPTPAPVPAPRPRWGGIPLPPWFPTAIPTLPPIF